MGRRTRVRRAGNHRSRIVQGAAPTRSRRRRECGVGTLRQQPPREVLLAHGARPTDATLGACRVAPIRARGERRARDHLTAWIEQEEHRMAIEGIPRGVRRLFRLPRMNAANIAKDVDDELRFHVEMRAAELMATGLDAESAMAEAWRSFGSASEVREHAVAVNATVVRRARALEWLAGMAQDARFALRQARRTPLFTLVAVVTLALGIGANTAIFSVVHRLFIAPFPFSDSDRMAWITMKDASNNSISLVSGKLFDAWRTRAHSLEAMGAIRGRDA